MDVPTSVNEVLDLAIQREIEAFELYQGAAQNIDNSAIRQSMLDMAEQERGHRIKLENVKSGNVRWAVRRSRAEPVTDLRLSDHLTAGSLDPKADYQDILLYAAKREKAAYEFYKTMAGMMDDVLIQNVFEMLAAEELRHKNRLEKIYEEVVYQDF